MTERAPFAGGDQQYLREVQYVDGTKLDARSFLHRTYGTSPVSFAEFEAGLIEWPPDGTVLECGCGNGRFWGENDLVSRAVTLTLTDLSQGMVDEALVRTRAAGFDQVAGRTCDVQSLPFGDAEFDVVVANHMLYHVPDPDLGVAELARVVRSDGAVLVATNGYGHMGEINDAIAEVLGSHGNGLYEVFGIDSGEARLRKQFASVVWHAFDNDLVVDDPAAVVAYGLSFPPGEHADEAQRAAVEEAVRRRFAGGPMRIRTRAGVFVCRTPRGR